MDIGPPVRRHIVTPLPSEPETPQVIPKREREIEPVPITEPTPEKVPA